MAVRNIFMRFQFLKAVTAHMLQYMISGNLPRIYSLKFGFNIRLLQKFTVNPMTNHNIL